MLPFIARIYYANQKQKRDQGDYHNWAVLCKCLPVRLYRVWQKYGIHMQNFTPCIKSITYLAMMKAVEIVQFEGKERAGSSITKRYSTGCPKSNYPNKLRSAHSAVYGRILRHSVNRRKCGQMNWNLEYHFPLASSSFSQKIALIGLVRGEIFQNKVG